VSISPASKARRVYDEEARNIEDIQTLVTEIEMLKFVLFLACRETKENKM
jgi:hypothetical protein